MSKRPPYEPIQFAQKLERTKDFCSDNQLIYRWTGTHWSPCPRRPPKVLHLWPPKLLHPAWGDLMH